MHSLHLVLHKTLQQQQQQQLWMLDKQSVFLQVQLCVS
jgi:hypothetical protein